MYGCDSYKPIDTLISYMYQERGLRTLVGGVDVAPQGPNSGQPPTCDVGSGDFS